MPTLSIITPCSRPVNLKRIAESIQFDKIDRWYIVYDTSPLFSKGENTSKQRTYEKQFLDNPKVSELECSVGCWGNPQRNLALGLITDGLVYYLDDDNIVHESFWSELDSFDLDHLYSFDQLIFHKQVIRKGGRLQEKFIDTAQYIVPRRLIGDLVWDMHDGGCGSDGRFTEDLNRLHGSKHIYVPKVLAYYNYLRA